MRVGGARGWVRGNLTVYGPLTGGPFSDGQNWWQLKTFEGFSQKRVFLFLSPSSVQVLSQCANCIYKKEKKEIKRAGSLLDVFCQCLCLCTFDH